MLTYIFSLSESLTVRQKRILNVNMRICRKNISRVSKKHPDCLVHVIDIVSFSTPFIIIGANLPNDN